MFNMSAADTESTHHGEYGQTDSAGRQDSETEREAHGHLFGASSEENRPVQNDALSPEEKAAPYQHDRHEKRSYRRKLIHTGFTLATYFALGLMPSQTGVSFLDLIHIVDSDIERGSLIFTLGALGYMAGSMIGGMLFDKFDNDAIFATCAFSAGLLTIAVPWCPFLPLMIAVVLLRSLFTGAMDSGGTVILLSIWGRTANPYMQALHFMFAVGGVCAPVITEPFLLSKELTSNQTAGGALDVNQTENISSRFDPQTTSQAFANASVYFDSVKSDLSSSREDEIFKVFISFIIVGVYTIITGTPFIIKFVMRKQKMISNERTLAESEEAQTQEQMESMKSSRVPKFYYILFGVYCFSYGCTEEVYAAFLMPFVVEHLHWTKSEGTGANSVYWGAFAGGRFLGIFIAKILSVRNMIVLDLTFIILGLIGFLVAAEKSAVAVWICNAVVGAAMASIFASTVTWLDQAVTPVTGKLAGYLVVTMSIGTMTNTVLLGYLFEEWTPMWFVYLTLGNTSLGLAIFVLINFINRKSKTHLDRQQQLKRELEQALKLKHTFVMIVQCGKI